MANICRTNDQRVLGQFLIEALLDRAVQIEVQCLCWDRQHGSE